MANQPARPSETQLWLVWGKYAPDDENRMWTLEVLKQNDLVGVDGNQRLYVTDRGTQLIRWLESRGTFLPVSPPEQDASET